MVASYYAAAMPTPGQIMAIDDWMLTRFGYPVNNYNGSEPTGLDMATLAREYFGLPNAARYSQWTLAQLQQELNNGYPVIIGVYTSMKPEYGYKHFMVLVGMDANAVYVNDPGRTNGQQKTYPLSDFQMAWKENADNAVVVIHPNGPPPQPTWTQKIPSNRPSARAGHSMAFDSTRSEDVLFGGQLSGNGYSGETWIWNGSTWIQKYPSSSPSSRAWHAMAFDSIHQQVVLFGGQNGSGNLNDTWVWDGSNWTQKIPATSPSIRASPAMVFDVANNQVVLFGGAPFGVALSDTWIWDGTTWTQKLPAVTPPARFGHAMVYDSARSQVLMFGGTYDYSGSYWNDTWVWDGSNWIEKSPSTSPTPRYYHGMAYDAVSAQVVVFGGYMPVSGLWDDTWTWSGSNWTQTLPSSSPSARCCHTMVFDVPNNQLLLFGGSSYSTTFGDTWVWK
jgi:hypothetical protein